MKERSEEDPTSWSYQAAIHGSEAEPALALWNQCEHGSWYFLAWHRMFLYYFEQIVRAAVVETGGPEDWALPYWNYGLNGIKASLPEAFREPADESNPLFVEQRAPGINEGAMIPPAITSDAEALSRPEFIGAPEFGGGVAPPHERFWNETGRLEQTPHNDIHNAVGRGGWMANPDEAAKDPIFWLHHANIDRIWATWNASGGANPADGEWLEQAFEFFDAEGSQVAKTCGEVLDTMEDLEYTYDPAPGECVTPEPGPEAAMAPPTPAELKVVGATAEKVTLSGRAAEIPVEIDERAKQEVSAASSESDPRRLFLNLEDIEGEVNPGSVYGIYVNLPEDAGPEQLEAHRAGNVSFFGIERARKPRDDEHAHGLRVSVEVGNLLRSLSEGDRWEGEQIDVTLRPLALIPGEGQSEEAARELESFEEDPPIDIGRVSLSVG
ncbi:MAG TPA: tyrosinase family protein [Solirubrobacterales bacterium]|nr:tyrosinase family protein [Solirubrobacterales bacterium]